MFLTLFLHAEIDAPEKTALQTVSVMAADGLTT